MQCVRSLSPEKQPYSGSNFHLSKPEILKVSSPSRHFTKGFSGPSHQNIHSNWSLKGQFSWPFLVASVCWLLRAERGTRGGKRSDTLEGLAQGPRRNAVRETWWKRFDGAWYNLVLDDWWLLTWLLVPIFSPSSQYLHPSIHRQRGILAGFLTLTLRFHRNIRARSSGRLSLPDLTCLWRKGQHVGSPWSNMYSYIQMPTWYIHSVQYSYCLESVSESVQIRIHIHQLKTKRCFQNGCPSAVSSHGHPQQEVQPTEDEVWHEDLASQHFFAGMAIMTGHVWSGSTWGRFGDLWSPLG